MTHYVGLDVSQKLTAICVVDGGGRRIWRGVCASKRVSQNRFPAGARQPSLLARTAGA